MPDLETSRLLFRKFTPDDLHDLAAIRADPDVMKYIGSGTPESVAEVESRLNKVFAHWAQHGFGQYALIEKTNGNLIGWCGFGHLEDPKDVEIAYGLAKPSWGNGLASEAASTILKYGFEKVGLVRIVAITRPDNLASERVLAKLGMKYVKTGYFYGVEMRYFAIWREEYGSGAVIPVDIIGV
jgi:RimJ/RimL family protein N-acetyltransferase